jgi:hypothetical protein
MKLSYLQILPILLLFSCHYISQERTNETKIRAVVVNPKKTDFYISKDFFQQDVDTLILDADNEVVKKIEISQEGLYLLHLFPEFQTIYLKPGDSLSMHINVDEFDESLSFSGGLGFENNLLIDLFLINEKQNTLYFKNRSVLTKKQLLKQIDSFALIKKDLLKEYDSELKNTSEKFKKIIDLYTKITAYSIKEDYISKHPNEKFSNKFLSHRNILKEPIVDHSIINLFSFVDAYFRNTIHHKNKSKEEVHQLLIENCNKKIYDKDFRSVVLTRYCYEYISNYKMSREDTIIKAYFSLIKSDKNRKYCKKLIRKNMLLANNKKFPSVKLIDKNGNLILSDSLLKDKKTIVSFWDLYWKKSFNSNHKKIIDITDNYTDLQVVVLNKNFDEFSVWQEAIPKQSNFNYYQLMNEKDISLLMPYSYAQVYLLINDTITGSMLNLYDVSFTKKMKQSLNR